MLRKNKEAKLKPEDTVRLKYELNPMDKRFFPNWTDVIYRIEKSIKGINKPIYVLKTFDGQTIPQRYYPEEVQKVKENLYRIEKLVKRQTVNGKPGWIVKWIGYSPEHNSWVPEEDIRNARRT